MDECTLSCPVPVEARGTITLAHGSGGRMMQTLITSMFASTFPALQPNHDAAVLELGDIKIAFTTDSFVVDPIFFPGGDIGSLAVHGSVNDTVMMGATKLEEMYVSIMTEEGYSAADLRQIMQSIHKAARIAGIKRVTYDTRVIRRGGEPDPNIWINTTCVGVLEGVPCLATPTNGVRPEWMGVAMIIEEGFPLDELAHMTASIQKDAQEAGITVVTGDTKVVERGCGKKPNIFITTSLVGAFDPAICLEPCTSEQIIPSLDVMLLGDIGRHGIAVMAAREGLTFDPPLESDSAPLNKVVQELLAVGVHIACMRDITRGGLASGLCELAKATGYHFVVDEESIPVSEGVRAACEMLGFDPMHVANEGRFIAFLPKEDAARALEICKRHEVGNNAAIIGYVGKATDETKGIVTIRTTFGGERIVEMLPGDQLPRIC